MCNSSLHNTYLGTKNHDEDEDTVCHDEGARECYGGAVCPQHEGVVRSTIQQQYDSQTECMRRRRAEQVQNELAGTEQIGAVRLVNRPAEPSLVERDRRQGETPRVDRRGREGATQVNNEPGGTEKFGGIRLVNRPAKQSLADRGTLRPFDSSFN